MPSFLLRILIYAKYTYIINLYVCQGCISLWFLLSFKFLFHIHARYVPKTALVSSLNSIKLLVNYLSSCRNIQCDNGHGWLRVKASLFQFVNYVCSRLKHLPVFDKKNYLFLLSLTRLGFSPSFKGKSSTHYRKLWSPTKWKHSSMVNSITKKTTYNDREPNRWRVIQ
jgi:hypothetical protein